MNELSTRKLPHLNISQVTTYQAGIAQATAHRTLQKYCDAVLKDYGITKMQWLIIGTILDAGKMGIRFTDLAEKLGTTMAYITNAINLLESRGVAMRLSSTTDGRSKFITLTEHAIAQCDEIEQTLRDALRTTLYSEIDPAEFKTYLKVLYRLSAIKG